MQVEVKETQSQEVDWTKNPQLVVSDDGSIVLVHENQEKATGKHSFVGTRLDVGHISEHTNGWVKSSFKPFHGEITLKND